MLGPAGSPTCNVYVDVTLTRSKVKVQVTGLLGKVSLEFKLHGMSIFHDIQMATYFSTRCYSHMVGYAGSSTYTAYVDMTLTRSKVKVQVTGLLNFRQRNRTCWRR